MTLKAITVGNAFAFAFICYSNQDSDRNETLQIHLVMAISKLHDVYLRSATLPNQQQAKS